MTITIIGFWEYPVYCYGTPFSALLMNYWKDTIKSFNIDHLELIDPDNQHPSMGDPDVKNFHISPDIDTSLTKFKETHKIVFLSEKITEATTLKDYVHHEDAVYVIGSDYQNIDQPFIDARNLEKEDYDIVTITLPEEPEWLWAHMVLPITLYDRKVKV